MNDKIDAIFEQVKIKLCDWLDTESTGSFSFKVFVNQGGLRGDPEIEIKEKLK